MKNGPNRMQWIILVGGFLVALTFFVINNIIIPAPYKEDLASCLEQARAIDDIQLSEQEKNTCFRIYPHFN